MTDERAHPPSDGAAPARRRRRGRRGGRRAADGAEPRKDGAAARERPGAPPRAGAPPKPAAERALETSHIDATKPADAPLTDDEVTEARQHLRFLFKNREVLRLKVNAAEDLLLNGARAPTHRGQVVHLLGKVDLACVTSALTRVADARARSAMLSGVVRFSTDVGILLLYLESLHDVASREEAAAAFRLAIGRIDFAGISSSRMRRVLDLVAATFEGHQRIQALFGLLASDTFRGAFDALREALPEALSQLFVPLRAAYETILEGRPNLHGADALRTGVRTLLDAPDTVLQSYPEAARERLLESAIRLLEDPQLEDRATDALLGTLPKESRAFSRIGMLRASELLRRHDDDAARALLTKIKEAHPGFHMPGKWLSALDAPRIARVALWREAAPGQLVSGFWLDQQRSAWVRIGTTDEAERMARDAMLQRAHAISGVAPVLECGLADDGRPYVLLPTFGRPVPSVLERRSLPREKAFALALAGAQVLHALALAGLQLADAEPSRFLAADGEPPALWLADMSGARRVGAEAASLAHRELARAWCEAMQAAVAERDLPVQLDDALPTLPDLIRSLAARA